MFSISKTSTKRFQIFDSICSDFTPLDSSLSLSNDEVKYHSTILVLQRLENIKKLEIRISHSYLCF